MAHTFHHADAEVFVEDANGAKKTIKVELKSTNLFVPSSTCETRYPLSLIEKILRVKGPAYLCDEIMRDESAEYVERHILYDVLGYVNRDRFKGKSALDFGCGSAASTMVLSRLLPDTRFTGVELEPSLLEIAELRASHYGTGDRVKFLLSPEGSSLPGGIGDFDFVFLNAVYEHLLPGERETVLPLLWSHLKPKGVLFINQTPYRWFPVETHTTSGLVFINYMPDSIASFYARRFSKRKLENDSWTTLLRRGIRGGSIGEITRILNGNSCFPVVLKPSGPGLNDAIDVWYAATRESRSSAIKRFLFLLFKLIKISTGHEFLPTLALALEKGQGHV